MLGAIAEFERDIFNGRVKEGVEAAKKKGKSVVWLSKILPCCSEYDLLNY